MASERTEHQLLALIEKMQRAGHDEAAIVRAVEEARDPAGRPQRRPARKSWRDHLVAARR
jgi:hypothetical protein